MLAAVSRLIYTVKVVGVITLHLFDINIFSMPRIFLIFTVHSFVTTVLFMCK